MKCERPQVSLGPLDKGVVSDRQVGGVAVLGVQERRATTNRGVLGVGQIGRQSSAPLCVAGVVVGQAFGKRWAGDRAE